MIVKQPFPTLIKSGHPQVKGLVSNYLVNRGSGAVLHDTAPSKVWSERNHGTIDGATWSSCENGNGLLFDKVNDLVNFGNEPDFNFSAKPFTAIGVFSVDDNQDSAHIFTKRFNGSLGSLGFFIGFSGTIGVFLELSDGSSEARITSTAPLPANYSFHHYVFIPNGSNSKIFVDGIQQDDGTNLPTGTINNSENAYIGNRADLNPGLYYGGVFCGLKVYNRALSDQEAKQHYKQYYSAFRRFINPFFHFPSVGNLSRYHDLSGLSGQGQMTHNPLG